MKGEVFMTRRRVLLGLALVLAAPGCGTAAQANADGGVSPLDPGPVKGGPSYEDNVDALFDVLIPAERDASSAVVSPGAREASAGRLFGDEEFVSLAIGLGLLSPLTGDSVSAVTNAEGTLRAAMNVLLDARTSRVRPFAKFSEVPRDVQLQIVDDAFADDAARPLMETLRVAAFVAYLGAVYSDVGIVAIGFPPYEDFENGVAVSGYPRTKAGKLIDAKTADLKALAAKGDLDDYTYNELPVANPVSPGLLPTGDLP
jgi:hypothetical protein